MTRTGRRATVALVAAVLLAGVGWWIDARTKPTRVGPRFVEAVAAHHPGSTVTVLDGGMVRVALAGGTLVDVRLSSVFDDCANHRLACSTIIERAVGDVDSAVGLARTPTRDALRPVVVAEAAGYRYGYVTGSLFGALELRYALVAGRAWTYVTSALSDRLGLSRDALAAAALANLRAEPAARLERIDEGGTTIFRVRATGDATASLVDDERMRRFADEVGARRLYVVVPTRDTLALGAANASTAAALDALRMRLRGAHPATLDTGLLLYDVDAPADRRLARAS